MEEQLRGLAEKYISLASRLGVELRYDEASVEWTDGYINRVRTQVEKESIESASNLIGSFLGECVIANYGGRWRVTEDGMAVCFDDANCVFPFAKVQKQFLNGQEDSILSFYTIIPIIFKDSIKAK